MIYLTSPISPQKEIYVGSDIIVYLYLKIGRCITKSQKSPGLDDDEVRSSSGVLLTTSILRSVHCY